MAHDPNTGNPDSSEPPSPEAMHLLQSDRRDRIKQFFQGPWVVVRCFGEIENGAFIFAALIPTGAKESFLEHLAWNFRADDLQPRVECVSHGSGEQDVYYLRHGNENGTEALFHCRSHPNHWPSSIELAEEFRLFFNLYHDQPRNVFLRCDINGAEEEVARITANSVEVKLAYLTRYLRAKQMHLAVQFDCHSSSTHALDSLRLKPETQTDKGENHHFELSIKEWNQGDEFRSVSRLIGKLVLPCPGLVTWEDPYADKHQTYCDFITAIDKDGNPTYQSSEQEKEGQRTNTFLTPVFFRRDVLQKYYGQPERYTVEDGRLACGGLWSLRLDNDHPKYVIAWLGDLGYLSSDERGHWKGFNVPPDGTFSRTFITRNIRAFPADPESPDSVLKQRYPHVNKAWKARFGWPLWKDPHAGDEYVFKKIHVSLNDGQSEFDDQNLLLAKLVVDFLNESELEKGPVDLPKDTRGIAKLTGFVEANRLTGGELHLQFLRNLQSIRSKGVHRKDERYTKALGALGVESLNRVDASRRIFQMAVDLLRWLESAASA